MKLLLIDLFGPGRSLTDINTILYIFNHWGRMTMTEYWRSRVEEEEEETENKSFFEFVNRESSVFFIWCDGSSREFSTIITSEEKVLENFSISLNNTLCDRPKPWFLRFSSSSFLSWWLSTFFLWTIFGSITIRCEWLGRENTYQENQTSSLLNITFRTF